MKNKPILLFILYISSTPAFAQSGQLNGAFRNSVYLYENHGSHTRIYQYLNLKAILPNNDLTVSTSMRALTDMNESITNEERYKLYSLRFDAQNLLHDHIDFAVGRMFLHPGTVLGVLDGGQLTVKPYKNLRLLGYGGVEGVFSRNFQFNSFEDSRVIGGCVEISDFYSTKLQTLYLQKSNENETFWRLTGMNISSNIIPQTVLQLQSHYDLEAQRLHRLQISSRNVWSSSWQTTLEYRKQFPQIYSTSYFSIFTPFAYQRLRLGTSVNISPDYHLQALYQHLFTNGNHADLLSLSTGTPYGDIGVIWENGYAGDQIGLMLNGFFEIFSRLIASFYVDYSKYRVEEIYEYDNLLSNALRLSYRLDDHISIDIEYQWLSNRFKSSDARMLNHISFIW
ncbi:MAG: hypothetical protein EHM72_05830 [Calditrichaeota bacterium]|nr:MAG: hypothetical protein EHM72_05830 [Calditrichota bacterium]